MKKLLSLIFLIVSVIAVAKAQHAIRASRAAYHTGQQVMVVDSIYDIRVYNDSTAVMDLGAKGEKTPLNVVFNFDPKTRLNSDALQNLNRSIVEVTGLIVMVEDQPTMVITDKNKISFISGSVNQNWAALSQLSYKTH